MIPKIMKYVKRIVTRQEKTRPRPQSRPRRQKTTEFASVYANGRLQFIVEVA